MIVFVSIWIYTNDWLIIMILFAAGLFAGCVSTFSQVQLASRGGPWKLSTFAEAIQVSLEFSGALHTMAMGVERTLYKLPLKGGSPLKYTNCGVCISLERKVCPLEESLGFHKYCKQTFLHQTNLSFGCWPLVRRPSRQILLSTNQIARIFCLLNR
jgi:hypothetical protein